MSFFVKNSRAYKFIENPPPVVDLLQVPDHWLTDFIVLLQKQNLPMPFNLANAFEQHIGETNRYRHKRHLTDTLKGLYVLLNNNISLQKLFKDRIIQTMSDSLLERTAGFHEKVSALYTSVVRLLSFDRILMNVRAERLDKLARESQDKVYTRHDYYHVASGLKLGLALTPSRIAYLSQDAHASIKSKIQNTFDTYYHSLALLPAIEKAIRRELSELYAYTGKQNISGYPRENYKAFYHYLKQVFNVNIPSIEQCLVYSAQRMVIDLNWKVVNRLIFDKLTHEGYFALTPQEITALHTVVFGSADAASLLKLLKYAKESSGILYILQCIDPQNTPLQVLWLVGAMKNCSPKIRNMCAYQFISADYLSTVVHDMARGMLLANFMHNIACSDDAGVDKLITKLQSYKSQASQKLVMDLKSIPEGNQGAVITLLNGRHMNALVAVCAYQEDAISNLCILIDTLLDNKERRLQYISSNYGGVTLLHLCLSFGYEFEAIWLLFKQNKSPKEIQIMLSTPSPLYGHMIHQAIRRNATALIYIIKQIKLVDDIECSLFLNLLSAKDNQVQYNALQLAACN